MTSATAIHVYRVDKFVVPAAAREEFLARVRETHALLGTQPGMVRNVVLELSSGPGRFNIVTVAEWESPASVEAATQAVANARAASGFNPQALFQRLGIEADLAYYTEVQGQ